MSSDTYPKTVQVSMTEHQHDKLRRYAFDCKLSMQGCMRDLIDGLGVSSSGKVVQVIAPKQPVQKPDKPKPDQNTCKHSFVIRDGGGSVCFKCGYHPPMT